MKKTLKPVVGFLNKYKNFSKFEEIKPNLTKTNLCAQH